MAFKWYAEHPNYKEHMKKLFIILAIIVSLPLHGQEIVECVESKADSVAIEEIRARLDKVRKERPTVALVLSGGGAKGAAEVGALRYLESIGMPVDLVLGTSIGGLLGGLYSIGYRAAEMDTLMRGMNWPNILTDPLPSRYLPYDKRQYDSKYLISVPFYNGQLSLDGGKKVGNKIAASLPGGFVQGRNVTNLLSSLTVAWQDTMSFAKLPIPFVCVATDMVSGKAKIWYSGSLVTAMRSTMSIPGLFAPVKTDGMVLVDGGLRDNFPVDIAKYLGADIVIGITLSQGFKSYEQMNNLMDLLSQATDLYARQVYERNLPMADVVIHPDLKGYDMMSFDPVAVDVMIERGYEAAVAKADSLQAALQPVMGASIADDTKPVKLENGVVVGRIGINGMSEKEANALRSSIGLKIGLLDTDDIEDAVKRLVATGAFENVTYAVEGDAEPYTLTFNCTKGPVSRAGVGVRFDNEELVSVLLNIGFNVNAFKGSSLDLTGKIGTNPYVSLGYKYKTGLGLAIGAESFYRYVDRNSFRSEKRRFKAIYHQFRQDIYLSNFSRKFASVKAGVRAEYYNVSSLLADVFKTAAGLQEYDFGTRKDTHFSAFGDFVLDSFDDEYFPTRGLRVKGSYSWHPIAVKAKGDGFHQFGFDASTVVRLSPVVTFVPSVYARALHGDNIPLTSINLAGGHMAGRYLDGQIPFVGVNGAFLLRNILGAGRADMRFRIAENHYITAMYNVAKDAPSLHSWVSDDWDDLIHGAALEYAWNTIAGPLRAGFQWNSLTKKTSFYFSLGKSF